MAKLQGDYNFTEMAERMPNMNFEFFYCPFCRDDAGKFAKIVLYIPKRDEEGPATQCNCNGEQEKCSHLLTLTSAFNSEKYLKKLIEKTMEDE